MGINNFTHEDLQKINALLELAKNQENYELAIYLRDARNLIEESIIKNRK